MWPTYSILRGKSNTTYWGYIVQFYWKLRRGCWMWNLATSNRFHSHYYNCWHLAYNRWNFSSVTKLSHSLSKPQHLCHEYGQACLAGAHVPTTTKRLCTLDTAFNANNASICQRSCRVQWTSNAIDTLLHCRFLQPLQQMIVENKSNVLEKLHN